MDHRKKAAAVELPQWNSRLRYSAQKHPGAGEGRPAGGGGVAPGAAAQQQQHQEQEQEPQQPATARKTPGLGQARRVPVPGNGRKAPGHHAASPPAADTTPTLCLFERFESLSLSTPATARPSASSGGAGAGDSAAGHGSQRERSVAFGTPSVLTYTPAATVGHAGTQGSATPLWSNAGSTPYSLPRQGAGAVLVLEADGGGGGGGAPRMELFSSIITDTSGMQGQQTPAPPGATARGGGAPPATPGGSAAAAAAALELPGDDGAEGPPGGASPPAEPLPVGTDDAAAADRGSLPASSGGGSFTGFAAAGLHGTPAAAGAEGEPEGTSTPPFFGKAAGRTPASRARASAQLEVGTPRAAAEATAGAAAAAATPAPAPTPAQARALASSLYDVGVCGRMPAPTPRSKLRQPARVPLEGARPAVPQELKQLLGDPDAAAAAAVAGPGESGATRPLLGSCDALSPVRPRRQLQQALGAGDQVLTPVRRSARKAAAAAGSGASVASAAAAAPGKAAAAQPPPSSCVLPMLEATNFCYQPNAALLQQDKAAEAAAGDQEQTPWR